MERSASSARLIGRLADQCRALAPDFHSSLLAPGARSIAFGPEAASQISTSKQASVRSAEVYRSLKLKALCARLHLAFPQQAPEAESWQWALAHRLFIQGFHRVFLSTPGSLECSTSREGDASPGFADDGGCRGATRCLCVSCMMSYPPEQSHKRDIQELVERRSLLLLDLLSMRWTHHGKKSSNVSSAA